MSSDTFGYSKGDKLKNLLYNKGILSFTKDIVTSFSYSTSFLVTYKVNIQI